MFSVPLRATGLAQTLVLTKVFLQASQLGLPCSIIRPAYITADPTTGGAFAPCDFQTELLQDF